MPGDQDDPAQARVGELVEQLETVAIRQHEIEQQRVRNAGAELRARTAERVRRDHVVAIGLEYLFGGLERVGIVVDEQYAWHGVIL
jgi:hypothetical protein